MDFSLDALTWATISSGGNSVSKLMVTRMMTVLRQRIVLCLLALLLGACVRDTAEVTPATLHEREMAIFQSALDTLLATERRRVVVDPRALSGDPATPDMRESSSTPLEFETQ